MSELALKASPKFPLSYQQESLWMIHRLDPDTVVYNCCRSYSIEGPLDPEKLKKALNVVIARNGILRSVFLEEKNVPVQVFSDRCESDLECINISDWTDSEKELKLEADIGVCYSKPFNLEKPPLLRGLLFKLSDQHFHLFLCAHHMVIDAWSWELLVRELFHFYDAQPAQLTLEECERFGLVDEENAVWEPSYSYEEFVRWQRQEFGEGGNQDCMAFWREQLSGAKTIVNFLPIEKENGILGGLYGKHRFDLFESDLEQIKLRSRELRVTPFVYLYSCFACVLSRFCGQSDLLIATPRSGRNRKEFENVIGFFSDILVLRSYVDVNSAFEEFVFNNRETLFSALQHQNISFGQLVKLIEPDRVGQRNPLVQVAFAFNKKPLDVQNGHGLSIRELDHVIENSRLDLEFHIWETSTGLTGYVSYKTDIIDQSSLEQFVSDFTSFVRSSLSDTRQRLGYFLGDSLSTAVASDLKLSDKESAIVDVPLNHSDKILEDVSGVWKSMLGIKRLSKADNFFRLGGHSLLAVQIASRLEQRLGHEIPLRLIFDNPEFGKFILAVSEHIQSGKNKQKGRQIERSGDRVGHASYGQRQIWVHEKLEGGSRAYTISRAWSVTGKLDTNAFESAANALVQCHESLRTNMFLQNGDLKQCVREGDSFKVFHLDFSEMPEGNGEGEVLDQIRKESDLRFDLEKDFPIRIVLIEISSVEFILILTLHHIASDGWSQRIFWRDLNRFYENFLNGNKVVPRFEKSVSYIDYAKWQRNLLAGDATDKLLNYWKRKLDGLRVAELSYDFNWKDSTSDIGEQVNCQLDVEQVYALREFCSEHEVSLQILLAAIFSFLLSRLTGSEDISLGIPFADRMKPELEKVIGFFVNPVILRVLADRDLDFRSYLKHVRAVSLEAMEYGDAPFEWLVEELGPERKAHGNPFFQILLNVMEIADEDEPGLGNLELTPLERTTTFSKLDLTFYVFLFGEKIDFNIVYKKDLFARGRIQSILDQIQFLLSQVIENPEQKLSSFSLAVKKEAFEKIPLKTEETILDRVFRVVRNNPEKVAIEWHGESLTFTEFHKNAMQLGNFLMERGLEKGDAVAVDCIRSPGSVVALFGIWIAGGIIVPIESSFASHRKRAMYKEGNASFLLYGGVAEEEEYWWSKDINEEFAIEVNLSDGLLDLELNELVGARSFPKLNGRDPAHIFFTSGTTAGEGANLKCIRGTHGLIRNFIDWQVDEFSVTPNDRIAQFTSWSFDVLLRDILLPLGAGGTLCIPEQNLMERPTEVLNWVADSEVTIIHSVPTIMQFWLNSCDGLVTKLDSLRWVFFAGEPLHDNLTKEFQEIAPNTQCVNFYGLTETVIPVCYSLVESDPAGGIHPVGKPLPLSEVAVFHSEEKWCGIGELGTVFVRQESGFVFHVQKNDTVDFYANETWYNTGDLGYTGYDGALSIVGRLDDQIKINGVRIDPLEVESLMLNVADVHACKVLFDEERKQMVAFVVARKEAPKELLSTISQQLPLSVLPLRICYLQELPLGTNGKIDRSALPLNLEMSEDIERYVAPANIEEWHLQKIWMDLFSLQSLSCDADFFDLGGNSMMAFKLIFEVRECLKVDLSLNDIFEARSISELGKRITLGNPNSFSALVPISSKGDRIPVYVVHGIHGDIFEFVRLPENLENDQPVWGVQAIEFSYLKRQHERLSEMVDHYVDELLKHNPHNPFFLCGFSSGGLLAFCIAQELLRRGRDIGMLFVIDSIPKNLPKHIHFLMLLPYVMSRIPIHLKRMLSAPQKLFGYCLSGMHSLKIIVWKGRGSVNAVKDHQNKQIVLNDKFHYQRLIRDSTLFPTKMPITLLRSRRTKIDLVRVWRFMAKGSITVENFDVPHVKMLSRENMPAIGMAIQKVMAGVGKRNSRRILR